MSINKDDGADLVEPLLDEATERLGRELFSTALPELAKDLPVLKYVATGVDAYNIFKLNKLKKRLTAFLNSLLNGEFSMGDFAKLEADEREMVIEILITEIDAQTDDFQSEALGLLFTAFVNGKIDHLTFKGIAHELKNTNPLVFYFNVDGFVLKEHKYGTVVAGPSHYLPKSFYSNSTEKLQFISFDVLTNLGLAFFNLVYKPMSERHTL